eukprot:CAMPEP_0196656624 /NCGR_PEP_ID=MMETSP1086-20130531/18926_1 /TAXON_ID=77921 /ORGANISM="Cyanoptyche  gloeocystis , Strain SAG4.97" /LENGTH=48 /DNA_ID= /DNA_START= /DNA_END= /DNA_ORIENTATION=
MRWAPAQQVQLSASSQTRNSGSFTADKLPGMPRGSRHHHRSVILEYLS